MFVLIVSSRPPNNNQPRCPTYHAQVYEADAHPLSMRLFSKEGGNSGYPFRKTLSLAAT